MTTTTRTPQSQPDCSICDGTGKTFGKVCGCTLVGRVHPEMALAPKQIDAPHAPADLEGLTRYEPGLLGGKMHAIENSEIGLNPDTEYVKLSDVQSLLATTKQAGEPVAWANPDGLQRLARVRDGYSDSPLLTVNALPGGCFTKPIYAIATAAPVPPAAPADQVRNAALEEAARACSRTGFLYESTPEGCAAAIRALIATPSTNGEQRRSDSGWISVEDRLPEVGLLVLVYTPSTKHDYTDSVNIGFDCIDQDDDDASSWLNHNEHYEHFCCVSKPEGSIGPSVDAPYTHWMPLPQPPSSNGNSEGEKA
jgi:hypothetical protein